MATPAPSEHWHLDKKVPIAMILVLLVQLGTGLWFAARMVERDESQERRLTAIEQASVQQNMGGRLSTVEAQLTDLKAGVSKIDGKLDRIIERGGRP